MLRLIKLLTSRIIIVFILILCQFALLFLWLYRASLSSDLMPLFNLLAIFCVIYIINKQEDPSYKIAWCVLILAVPVIGGALYILCGGRKVPRKLFDGTTRANLRMEGLLQQDQTVWNHLEQKELDVRRVFEYGLRTSSFPVYENTDISYFSGGEEFWPVLLEELKKAEHFIFLEFFIIDKGEMWDSVLEVLKEKTDAGVEVKLIYDDFGCANTLPYHYDRTLNSMGIETYRFNRMRPALITQMNNRDHRKIIVIDNRVGFTGGVNLADEYINRRERFGHWRDSALMIRGDAVWSLTVMFLGMYSFLRQKDDDIDYDRYRLEPHSPVSRAICQPFSDTPTDGKYIGLSVHLNLINHARRYIYIDTPYLVLNDDVHMALGLAAANGVDVRILVPHIPDKKYVFEITRSNYEQLIRAGVKVYEYTPGFNHSKSIVMDDTIGLVGTINTDYRSYYLHFEDGILFCDDPAVIKMRDDFLNTLQKSHEVTLEECTAVPLYRRLWRAVLRLLAPVM